MYRRTDHRCGSSAAACLSRRRLKSASIQRGGLQRTARSQWRSAAGPCAARAAARRAAASVAAACRAQTRPAQRVGSASRWRRVAALLLTRMGARRPLDSQQSSSYAHSAARAPCQGASTDAGGRASGLTAAGGGRARLACQRWNPTWRQKPSSRRGAARSRDGSASAGSSRVRARVALIAASCPAMFWNAGSTSRPAAARPRWGRQLGAWCAPRTPNNAAEEGWPAATRSVHAGPLQVSAAASCASAGTAAAGVPYARAREPRHTAGAARERDGAHLTWRPRRHRRRQGRSGCAARSRPGGRRASGRPASTPRRFARAARLRRLTHSLQPTAAGQHSALSAPQVASHAKEIAAAPSATSSLSRDDASKQATCPKCQGGCARCY